VREVPYCGYFKKVEVEVAPVDPVMPRGKGRGGMGGTGCGGARNQMQAFQEEELQQQMQAFKEELQEHKKKVQQELQELKEDMELKFVNLDKQLNQFKTDVKDLQTLFQGWCERDLHVTSAEIWKWAIQKKKPPKVEKELLLYSQEAQVYV
jgi:hypothetical protein